MKKGLNLVPFGSEFLNKMDEAWGDITQSVETIRRGNKK